MINTNWADNPWLQKRLLELREQGLTHKQIASKIFSEFPNIFPWQPPTRDSIKNAVIRAQKVSLLPEHPYDEEPLEEDAKKGEFIGLRTLFVDIEATDLGAAFGHILCCSFADEWGNVDTYRIDDPKYMGKNLIDDSKLAVAIRDRIESVDVVVGHNFRLYDKPFVNSRLLRASERPISASQKIVDSLYLAGGQNMRLGSRRLETIARFLRLPVQKTPLDGEIWQLAGVGDKDALDMVVEHCEHDVLVERLAFGRMKPFVSIIHR